MQENSSPTEAQLAMASAIFSLHSAMGKLISELERSKQEKYSADMNEAAESLKKLVRIWNL